MLNVIASYTLQVKTTFAGIHIAGSPEVLLGMIDDGITVPAKAFVVGTGVGPKIVAGESVKFTVFAANYMGIPRSGSGNVETVLIYQNDGTLDDLVVLHNADG